MWFLYVVYVPYVAVMVSLMAQSSVKIKNIVLMASVLSVCRSCSISSSITQVVVCVCDARELLFRCLELGEYRIELLSHLLVRIRAYLSDQ